MATATFTVGPAAAQGPKAAEEKRQEAAEEQPGGFARAFRESLAPTCCCRLAAPCAGRPAEALPRAAALAVQATTSPSSSPPTTPW